MANTVNCPKCENVVAFRAGESTVQCSRCGRTVPAAPRGSSPARGGPDARVLTFSLLFIFAGLVALGLARRGRKRGPTEDSPATIYTAPPAVTSAPTPAGVISWEPSSRSPVPMAIHD